MVLVRLLQCLHQVIQRALILGIDFESFPALDRGLGVLPGFQIKLCQHPVRGTKSRPQRDRFFRRTQGGV